MCSAKPTDDRTATARIRDAAIERFGEVGFAKATVREIAAAADVSPGLVLHHFGSKAGLREACDEYVVEQYSRSRNEAVQSGDTDPFAAMAGIQQEMPLLRYFLMSLREGSPAAARLFDAALAQTLDLMEISVDKGIIRPTENLHDITVMLLAWQFGGLVLQEHVARAFGAEGFSIAYLPRVARASLEILTHGVFADTRYEDAWNEYAASGEPPPAAGDVVSSGPEDGRAGANSAAHTAAHDKKER